MVHTYDPTMFKSKVGDTAMGAPSSAVTRRQIAVGVA
jgi:hypothetical protein